MQWLTWEAIDAIGSAVGGLGTVVVAIAAARISWLGQYGAKPVIGSVSIGTGRALISSLDRTQTFSVEVINRRKHEVVAYSIVVDGIDALLEREAYEANFKVRFSDSQAGRVRVWFEENLAPGEARNFEFTYLAPRPQLEPTNLAYQATVYESQPWVKRYCIRKKVRFTMGRLSLDSWV